MNKRNETRGDPNRTTARAAGTRQVGGRVRQERAVVESRILDESSIFACATDQ